MNAYFFELLVAVRTLASDFHLDAPFLAWLKKAGTIHPAYPGYHQAPESLKKIAPAREHNHRSQALLIALEIGGFRIRAKL